VNLMVSLGILLLAAQVSAGEPPALTTQKDKVNYAIGVSLINNFRQQGVEIDLDLVQQGMKDAYAGGALLLNDAELSRSIREYQTAVRQKQGSTAKLNVALANKKVGEAFLADNRKKEWVVSLPSGLQYKILKAGDGRKPTAADTLEYHYRGTLLNGKEVISSYKAGKPAVFKVKEDAIPGVAEALRLMRPGAKWQLFIPPQLAFGEQGQGGDIGPNTTLIYEVELLAIQ
jgi:FKBP-type peptidyl-prolyl cis-trans isomerase